MQYLMVWKQMEETSLMSLMIGKSLDLCTASMNSEMLWCGEAKFCFNADHIYLFGLAYTRRDSKKIWTTRTVDLVGIDFRRHPDNLEALLKIDIKAEPFNFQKSMDLDAMNNEIRCIDRKAHLFWENPIIDAKLTT